MILAKFISTLQVTYITNPVKGPSGGVIVSHNSSLMKFSIYDDNIVLFKSKHKDEIVFSIVIYYQMC